MKKDSAAMFSREKLSSRRGNSTTFALSVVILIGFSAFAVDLGYARVQQARVQSVLDAAGHAALGPLDGTTDGIDEALTLALEITNTIHTVEGVGLALDPDNVIFGWYDEDTAAFCNYTADSLLLPDLSDCSFNGGSFASASEVNAVRVYGAAEDISTFFAPMIAPGTDVSVGATVVSSLRDDGLAGAVDCAIPLAIPQCALSSADTDGDGVYEESIVVNLLMGHAANNAGWAVGAGESSSSVSTFIEAAGNQDSKCSGGSIDAGVSLTGALSTSVFTTLADVVNDGYIRASDSDPTNDLPGVEMWDVDGDGKSDVATSDSDYKSNPEKLPPRSTNAKGLNISDISSGAYGFALSGPVFVFDNTGCSSSCDCKFSSTSASIVGFVWGSVFDVVTDGSDEYVKLKVDPTRRDFVATAGKGEVGVGLVYRKSSIVE